MFKKISTLVIIVLLLGSSAQAGLIFTPSITYMSQTLNDGANPPETDSKLTIIDLRLGYVLDFGLYFGGLYSIQDQNLLADSSDSYFGPSIGYYNSGFMIMGTYYLYGERDLTSGSGKYTEVKGFQIDLSYSVPIAETLLIGPQLTYHNIEFDQFEASGFGGPTDYKLSSITPYFNITFLF